MRSIIALSLLTLPASLAAQEAAKDENKTIIVTAKSLKDTEKALKDCLARKCPPDEDSRATIAHAENQFVQGDMKAARGTLLSSIGRNGDQAKGYPTDVANLYRANARIAIHLGEGRSFQSSTLKTRDSLKAGLAADDWRVIASDIEVADMRAKLGYADEAARMYREMEAKAVAKGWNGMADIARLRSALLLHGSALPDKKAAGKKLLQDFALRTGDSSRSLRIASKMLLARTSTSPTETATLMREVNEEYVLAGGKLPQLLYSEAIEQPDNPNAPQSGGAGSSNRNMLKNLQVASVENNWADIGFWVMPDGKINDVEIIRSSQKDTAWLKPVLKSINSRVYSKTVSEEGSPGMFMVERYTLTALKEAQTGTRLTKRSPQTRIERLDLTELPTKSGDKG